ncbi:MAG: septum formation initiator family protein [Acidobacteria bacterium]|nr:septum formation initiator family protein [Acidobacteriota bacterium]
MKNRHRTVRKELCLILVILFCLGLIGFAIFGDSGWLRLQARQRQYEDLQAEISHLQLRNEALKVRIDKLAEDPDTVELEIRKRLLRIKPGETVYQITQPEENHDHDSGSR